MAALPTVEFEVSCNAYSLRVVPEDRAMPMLKTKMNRTVQTPVRTGWLRTHEGKYFVNIVRWLRMVILYRLSRADDIGITSWRVKA